MRPVGSTSGRPRVGAPHGPGGTKRPSRPAQQVAISASPQRRRAGRRRVSICGEHAADASGPALVAGAADEPARQPLQALDGVAGRSPRLVAQGGERRGVADRPTARRGRSQRVPVAQGQVRRERPQQRRGMPRRARGGSGPAPASGRRSSREVENVQAVEIVSSSARTGARPPTRLSVDGSRPARSSASPSRGVARISRSRCAARRGSSSAARWYSSSSRSTSRSSP